MTPERWQQIEQVLDAAMEQEPHAWEGVLDRLCADQPDLRAEVETLLHRHEQARQFLTTPAPTLLADIVFPDSDLDGFQVDRYRLVRELARGGMGAVYLAKRADGHFEQDVALKLLRPEVDAEEARQRLRAERQILAQLQHPGIARLLDGGVVESANAPPGAGQPYLVMEYIEGEPIDRYCDGRRLPLRRRLDLFLRVCDAVQYAHGRLVVHRDLKPSNILVTPDGFVKLLDFGIAKLIEPDGSAEGPLTRPGARWMTPEYAAPEQIRGDAVTTAADVYQLGVLLYELLSGRQPFEKRSRRSKPIEAAVLHDDPERPSRAVLHAREGPATGIRAGLDVADPSRARSTQPRRLRRALRGDLDAMVLKALRKEPEARYLSVEALAEDVRRHLAGLTVRARRGTLRYRAKAFVRRHRWALAAAAGFVLLLSAYAVTVTMQAGRLAEERDRAEQTAQFMTSLFQQFEPAEIRRSAIDPKDVLDRSVERIRGELGERPLLQARLMDAVGEVYQYWGFFPEAAEMLEEALSIRLRLLGNDHLDVAESRLHLGILRFTVSNPDNEALFSEAIATYRRRLPPDHPTFRYALGNYGVALRARGEYTRAAELFREVITLSREAPGRPDASLANARTYLGKLLIREGAYEEAESLLRDALTARRLLHGPSHPVVANTLDGVGELMFARGDYDAANQAFVEALEMRRDVYDDEEHPDVGVSLYNLALVEQARGDYAAAEELLGRSLAIARASFGAKSTDVAARLVRLAELRRIQRDPERAEQLYEEALAIWRTLSGPHPYKADLLLELADLRLAGGAAQAAEPLLREALEIRRQRLPPDDWRVSVVRSRLGECLSVLGRVQEARLLLQSAHESLLRARGPDDPAVRRARDSLTRLESSQNDAAADRGR